MPGYEIPTESMPERIKAVTRARGAVTKYSKIIRGMLVRENH